MRTFRYTIREELGMHARPAGLILQLAKEFKSDIIVTNRGREGDLKHLLSLINLPPDDWFPLIYNSVAPFLSDLLYNFL